MGEFFFWPGHPLWHPISIDFGTLQLLVATVPYLDGSLGGKIDVRELIGSSGRPKQYWSNSDSDPRVLKMSLTPHLQQTSPIGSAAKCDPLRHVGNRRGWLLFFCDELALPLARFARKLHLTTTAIKRVYSHTYWALLLLHQYWFMGNWPSEREWG